jgi:hypothetical protein
MYDIYIGEVETERLELIFSLEEEEHEKFFSFLLKKDKNFSYPYLNQLKNYEYSVNFYRNEIFILQEELESIKTTMNFIFLEKLRLACEIALEKNLELICSGEE